MAMVTMKNPLDHVEPTTTTPGAPVMKPHYRLNFEHLVLEGKINVARASLSMGSLLLSTSLPLILEFCGYVTEETALAMRIIVAITIGGLAAIFTYSDKIVFRFYAPFARKMLHRHILLFMEEIEFTLEYVKQKDHNFIRKSSEEAATLLQIYSEVVEDDSTLDDEFAVLNRLDWLAQALRDGTFSLGDLQLFYSIHDVFVMEDAPFLEAVILVRDEIVAINSPKVASFIRAECLGFSGRSSLLRMLKIFGVFVMTGTGLSQNTETVNSWVTLLITNEGNTRTSPNVVWASRFAAFFAYELVTSGSYNVISFLKTLLAEWECFDFEVFVNTSDKKYTVMDMEAVPITMESIAPVKLTPTLQYRKGFFGKKYCGNLHAFETAELLLVVRTYATVEFKTVYKKFNLHDKDKLIGLVKPRASLTMHTMMDFSEHPLIYETMKMDQSGMDDKEMLAMDQMHLRPSFD
jgi:hypothetical protein